VLTEVVAGGEREPVWLHAEYEKLCVPLPTALRDGHLAARHKGRERLNASKNGHAKQHREILVDSSATVTFPGRRVHPTPERAGGGRLGWWCWFGLRA